MRTKNDWSPDIDLLIDKVELVKWTILNIR